MAYYKLRESLREAERILIQHNEPVIGAKFLLKDLFDISEMDILLETRALTEAEYADYMTGVKQLSRHIPLAHITGFQMFYDRKFLVTPDVLVPRNETEELVELVIQRFGNRQSFVDIGTGSGAIAVTLALALENVTSYAVDISSDALQIACHNARELSADVQFFCGDLLQPLIDDDIKVDCLVSNPPYIAESERDLMNESALHDPHIALFADDEGLALYKQMIRDLPKVMNNHGLVAFEIGHAQGAALTRFIKACYPDAQPEIVQDINGLDRIIWFEWCE